MTPAAGPTRLPRLGAGDGRVAAAPPKASLLDRAAATPGLPVPAGVVVPADLLGGDLDAVAEQVSAAFDTGASLAVRSAFAAEDGAGVSGAGRFTTVLDVPARDPAAARDAIAAVLASADDVPPADRAVLVQRLVPARQAGVAFTQPAFEDDLVDHVEGLADGLVGGQVTGDRRRLPALVGRESPTVAGWAGRLQLLLRQVRDVFGEGPGGRGWDVEWADDGTVCWLIQVRPITAPPARDEVLTLANHREILPDPPSVLMTSLIVTAEQDAYGYWSSFAADLPTGRPFIERWAGRPLINLSLLADTMRRLGLPTDLVTDSMGGSEAERLLPSIGPRPGRLLRHLPALVRLGIDQLRAPTAARGTIDELMARVDGLDGGFVEALTAAQDVYVTLLHRMFALSTAIAGPLAVLQFLGVSAEHHARHRSAGTAVWDDLGPLRDLVAASEERREAVVDGRLPDDRRFRVAWSRFLGAHGHRGVHESDLSRPRYHEDPTPLLGLLLAEDRQQPVPRRTLLGRASTPLWWQAGRAIRAREELRSGAMRAFDVLRQRLLTLAEAAVDDGLLPAVDDVWWCEVEQLRAIDGGTVVTTEDVAAARERIAEIEPLRLPDAVRRSGDPTAFHPDRSDHEGTDRLRGLPLTTGDVTGTVWRLDAPAGSPPHDGTVVLVAPAVDAGWIGTFAQVDAVVVETGGELSHGSIVLRERGVPAVTNVAGATRLRDGARVRVRARAGVVEVLASSQGS